MLGADKELVFMGFGLYQLSFSESKNPTQISEIRTEQASAAGEPRLRFDLLSLFTCHFYYDLHQD